MASDVERALRDAGLRVTPARRAVYGVLSDQAGPLSHGEVWARLDPGTLDRTTVYRNLLALVEAGLVQRMDLGDHVWRFELARAPEPHGGHPHFVCTECGQVECLDDVEIELKAPRGGSARALGGRAVQVQLRGRCDECT